MPWPEIFIVLLVCHAVGDFLLQTEWQAENKRGGLGPNPVARRALAAHIFSYTVAFIPALIWLADSLGAGVLAIAALISLPHAAQDDGRFLDEFMIRVKHAEPSRHPVLFMAVDQSFHLVMLFLVALVAA